MDENLKYIKDHFIECNELCVLTNISTSVLSKLITDQVLPEPSYVINTETTITSALNDSHTIHNTQKYFGKNTIGLIESYKDEYKAVLIKENFCSEMLAALKNADDKHLAYGNILDDDQNVDFGKFEKAFEEEWRYFCKGVYGICTLNATAEEIIKKEITVKKLIDFNNKFGDQDLDDDSKDWLRELGREFDAVTSLFAPYQRETSSRGKYLDQISQQNAMNDLIKTYP